MAKIILEFTSTDNKKALPIAVSNEYTIETVRIEANSLNNLVESVRKMYIYILMTLSGKHQFKTLSYHFSDYIIMLDTLIYEFDIDESFNIPSNCIKADISIVLNILPPVVKITLIIEDHTGAQIIANP